jgi:formylglycine-generating enzyme required for sulfatase activity
VKPRILRHDVEDLRQARPGVPRELSVLCRKCLEREPGRRYQTMAAVAEDLARYLRNEPILAAEPGVVERARKWSKRNPTASAVLATVTAGVVVAGWLANANAALAAEKTQLAAAETAAKEAALQQERRADEVAKSNQALATQMSGLAAEKAAETERALASERLAQESLQSMRQRADEVLSLSTFQDLADLVGEAERLWPIRPESAARCQAWLDRFRLLVDGSPAAAAAEGRRPSLADQRRRLAALRESARAPAAAALSAARADHRLTPQVAALQQTIATFDAALSTPDAPDWLMSRMREQRSGLARQLALLNEEIDAETRWLFDRTADRWWHAQLGQLIRQFDRLLDPDQGLATSGIGEGIGWGVQRRLDYARTVAAQCCESDAAKAAWRAVADGLAADARFAGFGIAPQLDLIPLGRDPKSGLFEFAHLPSGTPPTRGADGELVYAPDAAIVLVLVPGGTFDMGAQAADPALPNFDPDANTKTEGPVHAVTLTPYFFGKHEITQSQWHRLTGSAPSQYPAGGVIQGRLITLRDPVERVDWNDCAKWLPRFGLTLPTEAQWERAARAGGTDPWSTGRDVRSIEGAANVADQRLMQQGGPKDWSYDVWLDDGFVVHAAVGTLRPNAYGLHDVHGNVAEWCRDGEDDYGKPAREGDGLRSSDMALVVYRGGGFMDPAIRSRCAGRLSNQAGNKTHSLGVRAARIVQPPR